MNFIKSFFQTSYSDKYEDYSQVYVRWERNGKVYGPYNFEDLLTRKWSGPPIECRFENETKWREYSYFFNIFSLLKISQKQIIVLKSLGVDKIEPTIGFMDAMKLIQAKNEEISKQKEIEKIKKESLPATKQTIKKLRELGIEFKDDITRSVAKELISEFEEKEHLKEIFEYFKKNNYEFIQHLSIDNIISSDDETIPTYDQFDELYEILISFSDYKLELNFPNTMSKNQMESYINKLDQAKFEAEDIIEQLNDREILIDVDDYKIIGKLHKIQIKELHTEIMNKYLNDSWNPDKELFEIIKKHFPELILKKID